MSFKSEFNLNSGDYGNYLGVITDGKWLKTKCVCVWVCVFPMLFNQAKPSLIILFEAEMPGWPDPLFNFVCLVSNNNEFYFLFVLHTNA